MDTTAEPNSQAGKILIHPPQGLRRDLIVGFLSRCRDGADKVGVSLERNEFEAVRVFGHRLKGSGGGYGLPKLTEIGAAVERAAVDNNAGELRRLLGALETYLNRLEIAAV